MSALSVILLSIAALLITGTVYACCIMAGQADDRLPPCEPPRAEEEVEA